ncbi:hypothetical protein GQX74_008032 [Glossina fuscipes]|nr:hypothetical protein GQX74_008032 [Glossina fuscipes]
MLSLWLPRRERCFIIAARLGMGERCTRGLLLMGMPMLPFELLALAVEQPLLPPDVRLMRRKEGILVETLSKNIALKKANADYRGSLSFRPTKQQHTTPKRQAVTETISNRIPPPAAPATNGYTEFSTSLALLEGSRASLIGVIVLRDSNKAPADSISIDPMHRLVEERTSPKCYLRGYRHLNKQLLSEIYNTDQFQKSFVTN